MEKEKVVESDGYVILNGMKGIWTLDTVVQLLVDCGVKMKLSLDVKREVDYILPREIGDESGLQKK